MEECGGQDTRNMGGGNVMSDGKAGSDVIGRRT